MILIARHSLRQERCGTLTRTVGVIALILIVGACALGYVTFASFVILQAAWMAVVAAELSGVRGLGSRMMQASSLLATDIVVVYMLTMALLYGVFDAAFTALQRWMLRWRA